MRLAEQKLVALAEKIAVLETFYHHGNWMAGREKLFASEDYNSQYITTGEDVIWDLLGDHYDLNISLSAIIQTALKPKV